MEYFGLMAFILVLYYSGYLEKIKKHERKIKTLERSMKGENKMSKLINDLIGEECIIKSEEALFAMSDMTMKCEIIDVDDEWVKISFVDKKGNSITKIIRIDSIENIELI